MRQRLRGKAWQDPNDDAVIALWLSGPKPPSVYDPVPIYRAGDETLKFDIEMETDDWRMAKTFLAYHSYDSGNGVRVWMFKMGDLEGLPVWIW